MKRASTIQTVVTGVLMSGCIAHGAPPGMQEEIAQTRPTVVVINNNWADVSVSVVAGSIPYALGRVTGFHRRSFKVPGALQSATVRFVLREVGSRAEHVTREITLEGPSRQVEVRVGARLSASELVIR